MKKMLSIIVPIYKIEKFLSQLTIARESVMNTKKKIKESRLFTRKTAVLSAQGKQVFKLPKVITLDMLMETIG